MNCLRSAAAAGDGGLDQEAKRLSNSRSLLSDKLLSRASMSFTLASISARLCFGAVEAAEAPAGVKVMGGGKTPGDSCGDVLLDTAGAVSEMGGGKCDAPPVAGMAGGAPIGAGKGCVFGVGGKGLVALEFNGPCGGGVEVFCCCEGDCHVPAA